MVSGAPGRTEFGDWRVGDASGGADVRTAGADESGGRWEWRLDWPLPRGASGWACAALW